MVIQTLGPGVPTRQSSGVLTSLPPSESAALAQLPATDCPHASSGPAAPRSDSLCTLPAPSGWADDYTKMDSSMASPCSVHRVRSLTTDGEERGGGGEEVGEVEQVAREAAGAQDHTSQAMRLALRQARQQMHRETGVESFIPQQAAQPPAGQRQGHWVQGSAALIVEALVLALTLLELGLVAAAAVVQLGSSGTIMLHRSLAVVPVRMASVFAARLLVLLELALLTLCTKVSQCICFDHREPA